jgi:PilZ domain
MRAAFQEATLQPIFREKRTAPRSRVFFGGEIVFDAELPAVECHIKNVSQTGASVIVQSSGLLPDQFDLIIRKTSEQYNAVVKWSRGRQLGIAYRPRSSRIKKRLSPSELRQALGLVQT